MRPRRASTRWWAYHESDIQNPVRRMLSTHEVTDGTPSTSTSRCLQFGFASARGRGPSAAADRHRDSSTTTLEVGMACGVSLFLCDALHRVSGARTVHYALDPFQSTLCWDWTRPRRAGGLRPDGACHRRNVRGLRHRICFAPACSWTSRSSTAGTRSTRSGGVLLHQPYVERRRRRRVRRAAARDQSRNPLRAQPRRLQRVRWPGVRADVTGSSIGSLRRKRCPR